MKSESGSNMSCTIVRFIKWRWYRHKDLFISQCPQRLSEESQSVVCIIPACSRSSAMLLQSSECAPAMHVSHLSGCLLINEDGIA